jgi:hypothetical protein
MALGEGPGHGGWVRRPDANEPPVTFPADPGGVPAAGDGGGAARQGLTLVHFSAQPEPFLTQNNPYYPLTLRKHFLNDP